MVPTVGMPSPLHSLGQHHVAKCLVKSQLTDRLSVASEAEQHIARSRVEINELAQARLKGVGRHTQLGSRLDLLLEISR